MLVVRAQVLTLQSPVAPARPWGPIFELRPAFVPEGSRLLGQRDFFNRFRDHLPASPEPALVHPELLTALRPSGRRRSARGRERAGRPRRLTGYELPRTRPDGGYPLQGGGESNAQSTAWAVQGLLAAGRDPSGVVRGGRSPLGYLEGLIASDGSVRYSSASTQRRCG
jgi:hypothetical protein